MEMTKHIEVVTIEDQDYEAEIQPEPEVITLDEAEIQPEPEVITLDD